MSPFHKNSIGYSNCRFSISIAQSILGMLICKHKHTLVFGFFNGTATNIRPAKYGYYERSNSFVENETNTRQCYKSNQQCYFCLFSHVPFLFWFLILEKICTGDNSIIALCILLVGEYFNMIFSNRLKLPSLRPPAFKPDWTAIEQFASRRS